MTVKQLKEWLKNIPDDTFVILSSDAEGNQFHHLMEGSYPVLVNEIDIDDDDISEPVVILWPED